VARPVITIRQRRTDLFVALIFQVLALITVNELLRRGDYPLPAMAISGATFVTASIAALYVLVVSEFKPVAFETTAFVLWILTDAAFAVTAFSPSKAKLPEMPQEERRAPIVVPQFTPHFRSPIAPPSLKVETLSPEVEKIKNAWPALPEDTRKSIVNQVDQKLEEQNLPPENVPHSSPQ
jgi:hypothetical protein